MRRILVETARKRNGPKAGGKHERVNFSDLEQEMTDPQIDILAISGALNRLEAVDPRAAELVKLRLFVGFSRQQAAEALARINH